MARLTFNNSIPPKLSLAGYGLNNPSVPLLAGLFLLSSQIQFLTPFHWFLLHTLLDSALVRLGWGGLLPSFILSSFLPFFAQLY